MKFPASGGSGEFRLVPAGTHIAVCNLLADCGLQPGYEGKPTHKIYMRFEIPAERVEFERDGVTVEGPMTVGAFYTASMHEKATLRKHLESWRGKRFTDEEAAEFDVSRILGQAVMLTIMHSERNGRVYPNIVGMSRLPAGVKAPAPENPLLYYDSESGEDALMALPKWLRERIQAQIPPQEKRGSSRERAAASPDFDDEIPF